MSQAATAERLRDAEVEDAPQLNAPLREPSKAGRKATAKQGDNWHRFAVDIWITNLNTTEFGIYKHTRNKAKSRQFSSDMDIYAEVIENGERTALLGYREELWRNQSGFDRRLVIKLFGEKLNWRATMDLMLGRSVQETIGARGLPVTCFAINTNDHEQVVYLERSANKWRGMPEHFSFFLMDEGRLRFYRLKQNLVSIGQDYSVYDGAGNSIGLLDGRIFSLGGFWKCKVRKSDADPRLLTVLKLFTGMLVFNTSCRQHVQALAQSIKSKGAPPKVQRQEADLYMNPRRVR
jgi:hypothetical protein